MHLNSAWREWYRLHHRLSFIRLSGEAFEDYITSLLTQRYDDFINPTPKGRLGDGGCDGLAENGDILFAAYGSRAKQDAESKLVKKLGDDFARGLSQWAGFTRWRFITNAALGRKCADYLTSIQKNHGPNSIRPLSVAVWTEGRVWSEVVAQISEERLMDIFPGVPGTEVTLTDMLPLLDLLSRGDAGIDDGGRIRPVPMSKMDFNRLSPISRIELNSGRVWAPTIDRWLNAASNPDLRDIYGENFSKVYRGQLELLAEPTEILERVYIALGGPNFRVDNKRANAVYAVTSYFFDSCHIFEEPPSESVEG